MKAATVAAAVGGTLAVAQGMLLIVLGSLAGLAENPAGGGARTGGVVLLALGAIALTAVFAARRSPLVLAVTTAATAAVGFLVENPLWVFAAAFLFAAAVLGVISTRAPTRPAKPS
jgi:hypothetical protein